MKISFELLITNILNLVNFRLSANCIVLIVPQIRDRKTDFLKYSHKLMSQSKISSSATMIYKLKSCLISIQYQVNFL